MRFQTPALANPYKTMRQSTERESMLTLQTSDWLDSLIPPEANLSRLSNQSCRSSTEFKYFAYTVTYSMVFPLAFVSNSVALFVFLRLTTKKTANTVFMTNLALSDIGFSLTLPFRLIYYFRGCKWDFPDWLCRWCVFSFYLNLYTSVLFLTGLSMLRYIAVLKPFRNNVLVTARKASLVCLGIWAFVAGSSSPFLLTGTLQREGKIRCFEPGGTKSWERILILNYAGLIFGFLIPFVTILVCYSCILCKLMTRQRVASKGQQKHCRTLYMITMVLTTFVICFLPYHTIRTVHLHAVLTRPDSKDTCWLLKAIVVTLCLAATNSCFNPLLYYFTGRLFRNTIRGASRQKSLSSINGGRLLSLHQRRQSCCMPAKTITAGPSPRPTMQPEIAGGAEENISEEKVDSQ